MDYSKPIRDLINSFKMLPGVGQKTAERYVFHILKSGKKEAGELAVSLRNLLNKVQSCERCWDFSSNSPCKICSDKDRDHSTVCVVAEPQDKQAIEQVEKFNGVYHVLRGTLQPDRERNKEYIKIEELLDRIEKENIEEVILALDHNMEGETTMMYIQKQVRKINSDITISQLARGLPMGSSLQYADEITLGSAIKNRVDKNK